MDTSNRKLRVCVIGAGQAGMATLYYFAKLGNSSPEVTCYERGATWGGQWNCTWRTGYWKSSDVDLSKMIRFHHVVTSVRYNADTDDFTVVTRDLDCRKTNPPETYSHVIVATGQYTYPNAPEFKGFDTFPGRILHSQQFRGAHSFKGKRILVIGAHLSAEDIASQSYKYGAQHVIITWKNKPLGFNFPEGVEERPLLQEVEGNVAKFKDGSTAEIDIIVLCTGYNMAFPYLEDSLKLAEQRSSFFPDNLYKGVVWLGGGNNKLLYLQTQHVPLMMTYADVQAAWVVRYITGVNPINADVEQEPGLIVDAVAVKAYLDTMRTKFFPDEPSQAAFITACCDYVQDIVDDIGHAYKPAELANMLMKTIADRDASVLEFRNCQFTSLNTGVTAAPLKTKWIDNFQFNIDDYVE